MCAKDQVKRMAGALSKYVFKPFFFLNIYIRSHKSRFKFNIAKAHAAVLQRTKPSGISYIKTWKRIAIFFYTGNPTVLCDATAKMYTQ